MLYWVAPKCLREDGLVAEIGLLGICDELRLAVLYPSFSPRNHTTGGEQSKGTSNVSTV